MIKLFPVYRKDTEMAFKPRTPFLEAVQVMEGAAVGIDFAVRNGFSIPSSELQRYSYVPFSREELIEASDMGYTLVAMPSVSIASMRSQFPHLIGTFSLFPKLAVSRTRFGYHLIKFELEDGTKKTWEKQQLIQPEGYAAAYMCELVYFAVTRLTKIKHPYGLDVYVRCADVQDGCGDNHALDIYGEFLVPYGSWNFIESRELGVSSSKYRKF